MNCNSFNRINQEPTSAFEIFFLYNRNVLLHNASIDAVSKEIFSMTVDSGQLSSSSTAGYSRSDKNKQELYERHVMRLLNVTPPAQCSPTNFNGFREHVRCIWKVTDESTKEVFRRIAKQYPERNLCSTTEYVLLSSGKLHQDEDFNMRQCPIIHSPRPPTKRARLQCGDPPITKSLCQGTCKNERDFVSSVGASNEDPLVVRDNYMSKIENETRINEMHEFLSKLDWDRLCEGDEKCGTNK